VGPEGGVATAARRSRRAAAAPATTGAVALAAIAVAVAVAAAAAALVLVVVGRAGFVAVHAAAVLLVLGGVGGLALPLLPPAAIAGLERRGALAVALEGPEGHAQGVAPAPADAAPLAVHLLHGLGGGGLGLERDEDVVQGRVCGRVGVGNRGISGGVGWGWEGRKRRVLPFRAQVWLSGSLTHRGVAPGPSRGAGWGRTPTVRPRSPGPPARARRPRTRAGTGRRCRVV
jgi:hypothetical protein